MATIAEPAAASVESARRGRLGWPACYIAISLIGIALSMAVVIKSRHDYAEALADYRTAAHAEAIGEARRFEGSFKQIYQTLRTIGLLPSLRGIDRYGKTLSDNDNRTIQQVYNNIAGNLAVSEVYIVLLDLNGEAIDPVTHRTGARIISYDQLIAGPDDAASGGDGCGNLRAGARISHPSSA
jgi:hypothetical protein